MMVDYVAALMDLVPNALISYTGVDVDYDDIDWLDERAQPSREECDAVWPEVDVRLRNGQAQRSRSAAYASESDPLFFKWQRDEGSKQDWLDKVEEIRERFPYVDGV